MRGRRLGVAAVVLAKKVPGDPFRVLAQDLVVDVLEHLDLDRIARPVHRLDAVDHRAPGPADEVAVEKRDRRAELSGDLGLPIAPGVGVEALPRHPLARVVEYVQVVAVDAPGLIETVERRMIAGIDVAKRPIEHPPGVGGVVLGVAAGTHVEEDARAALLPPSGVGELEPELGLADAGRSDDDGKRAGQEPPADEFVEPFDAGGQSCVLHDLGGSCPLDAAQARRLT